MIFCCFKGVCIICISHIGVFDLFGVFLVKHQGEDWRRLDDLLLPCLKRIRCLTTCSPQGATSSGFASSLSAMFLDNFRMVDSKIVWLYRSGLPQLTQAPTGAYINLRN
jgi:hypothetical protein